MNKILMLLLSIFIIGCSVTSTAKTPVEGYLNSYQDLSYEVMLDMEKVVEEEDLSKDQKELYRAILKKQYEDLKYEIIEETYDEDEAVVTVKISVYDYYKASKESAAYLKENVEEFHDDEGKYSNELYMEYKLNRLKKVTDKIEYNLEFEVIKENDVWKLNSVTNADLEKIHGIYNYEE